MQIKKKIDALQILRALAAILVVINHLWGDSNTNFAQRYGLKYMGDFGVDAFFILSGFIMCYKTREDSRLGVSTAIDFMKRRIERIYPIYLLVLLPFIVIYIVKTHPANLYNIFGNIFLLPTFTSNPNYLMMIGPSWTLVYEMFFYAIYALMMMLVSTKRQLIFFTTGLLVFMVTLDNIFALRGPPLGLDNFRYMIGDPLMINFALGCVYAQVFTKLPKLSLSIPLCATLILAIFLMGMWLFRHGTPRLLSFGFTSLFIVFLFSIMRESTGRIYQSLIFIGNASFSIYITHFFFAYSKHYIFAHYSINKDLFGVLYTLIAVAFGCLFYLLIETRVITFFAKLHLARRVLR